MILIKKFPVEERTKRRTHITKGIRLSLIMVIELLQEFLRLLKQKYLPKTRQKKEVVILCLKAIKSCKHGNKCILIRVKLLVNEFALGCCIVNAKI